MLILHIYKRALRKLTILYLSYSFLLHFDSILSCENIGGFVIYKITMSLWNLWTFSCRRYRAQLPCLKYLTLQKALNLNLLIVLIFLNSLIYFVVSCLYFLFLLIRNLLLVCLIKSWNSWWAGLLWFKLPPRMRSLIMDYILLGLWFIWQAF